MNGFRKIEPMALTSNVFEMLDRDWMLITAGDMLKHNTMTASWGMFGFLWRKPVVNIFIRPQRYTYNFVDESNHFSLSFFGTKYREALNICGTKSGRDIDKIKEANLTPIQTPNGTVSFLEARLIFDCVKLYSDDIVPNCFNDNQVPLSIYPQNDFHRFFIGEIVGCYERVAK